MQITVFHCVHKEIDNAFSPGDNYSFHESGLQITLCLLCSSLGKKFFCIRYFSNTKHKPAKKKLDNVFQSNCSSHAKLLTNLRKIEKRPKMRQGGYAPSPSIGRALHRYRSGHRFESHSSLNFFRNCLLHI